MPLYTQLYCELSRHSTTTIWTSRDICQQVGLIYLRNQEIISEWFLSRHLCLKNFNASKRTPVRESNINAVACSWYFKCWLYKQNIYTTSIVSVLERDENHWSGVVVCWWVKNINHCFVSCEWVRGGGGVIKWRHNGYDGVSNHQPHHCLLNRLFGRRSKKASKFCATGICAGNSPVTREFPAQMASNAENVSI